MAVSRDSSVKKPSQNPVKFFQCQQQGGADGKPTSVPDKLASGELREKIYGRENLGKS